MAKQNLENFRGHIGAYWVTFRKCRISERNSLAQKIFLKTCFSRLFSIIFEKDFSSPGSFSKTKYIVYYMIYNMKPLCIFLICCGFGLVNIYRFIYRSLIFTDFGGGRKSHLCGRFLFSTVEGWAPRASWALRASLEILCSRSYDPINAFLENLQKINKNFIRVHKQIEKISAEFQNLENGWKKYIF